MRNEGFTGPNGPSPRASGRFLLIASLTVWLGSTFVLYVLSKSGGAAPFGWAIAGGCASGLLAGFRTHASAATTDPAVWFLRLIMNLLGAAIGFAVVGYLVSGSDVDPHWASFFLAMFTYAVARDFVKTTCNAVAARDGARKREEERAAQTDQVLELLLLQSTAASIYRLPHDA